MKATKLTRKERDVFERLKATPGGVLRKHVNPSNIMCYRLLDSEYNPIINVRMHVVDQLREKDVLELVGHDFVLKATSALYHG